MNTSFKAMLERQTKKEMLKHQIWLIGVIERAPESVRISARKQLDISYAEFDKRFARKETI